MKHGWMALLSVALLLGASRGDAKIPPLSEQALLERSDLIVSGTIAKIRDKGAVTRDHCYGWQARVATLKVARTFKGKGKVKGKGKTLRLAFRTRVENTKGCVGGKTSYAFRRGHRYKLHLARHKDDKGPYYTIVNWAGVKHLGPAHKPRSKPRSSN